MSASAEDLLNRASRFDRRNGPSSENEHREEARTTMPPAPVFPDHVLPPAVRSYVLAGARSIGQHSPPEMIAAPLLAIAGALIGNRIHLRLKSSWNVYATLYLAVVADPGAGKSPALNLATAPVKLLQKDAQRNHDEAMLVYQALHAEWSKPPKDAQGPEPVKPRLREYFSSDITLESLAVLLQENPGVAVIRDEVVGWVKSLDQYRNGKGADRQHYLSLWTTDTLKVNRKGGPPVYCPTPVACVTGGIQPDFVPDLRSAAGRDGFVERILPVVPDAFGEDWTDDEVTTAQYAAVLDVFRQLDKLPPVDRAADGTPGIGVHLDPEARTLFIEWRNQNTAIARAAGGEEAGFHQKLDVHLARFALILHALWHADDPRVMVTAQTMGYAIELAEFFRRHIARFLFLLGQPATNGADAGVAARILRILRTKAGDWFTRSELLHALGNVRANELSEALRMLEASNKAESKRDAGTTKPVESWRLKEQPGSKYSKYSNNPGATGNTDEETSNSSNTSNQEKWEDGPDPFTRPRSVGACGAEACADSRGGCIRNGACAAMKGRAA